MTELIWWQWNMSYEWSWLWRLNLWRLGSFKDAKSYNLGNKTGTKESALFVHGKCLWQTVFLSQGKNSPQKRAGSKTQKVHHLTQASYLLSKKMVIESPWTGTSRRSTGLHPCQHFLLWLPRHLPSAPTRLGASEFSKYHEKKLPRSWMCSAAWTLVNSAQIFWILQLRYFNIAFIAWKKG